MKFKAYFDESGKHDSPILTLAGYIATDEQWGEFEREWREVLSTEGISVFHMSKFESGFGEFSEDNGWTRQRRVRLQSKLIGIIKRRVNIGLYCSIDLAAYESCLSGWRRDHFGSPYAFCVKNLLAQVSVWCQAFKRNDPIDFIIEQGAGYNHELSEAFKMTLTNEILRNLFRLGSLTFETKLSAIHLQAADILAYEVWKDECNSRLNPTHKRRPPRESLRRLSEITHWGTFYGKEEFEMQIAREEAGDYSVQFPDGTMNWRRPEINKLTISGDSSELDPILSHLARLVEFSPHLVYSLIDTPANVSKAISIHTDDVSTGGTRELRVTFKPSDFLLDFMRTLGAVEAQDHVTEESDH